MPCPGPSAKDATHGLARRLHQAPTGEKSTPNLCTSLAVAGCPVYRRRCPAGWGMAEGKWGWRLQKGKDEGGDRCPFGSGGWLCHSELLWPVGLTLVLRDARATWGELVKESERGVSPKGLQGRLVGKGPWPLGPATPWSTLSEEAMGSICPPSRTRAATAGLQRFPEKVLDATIFAFAATERCFRRFSTQDEGRGSLKLLRHFY